MRMNLSPPISRRQSEKGFSLFEIIVAVTILGMISGSVLSILWQAGGTSNEIRELDKRDEELSVFLNLLKRTVEGMPEGGSMEMIPPSESGSGMYELKISDAVTAFDFGERLGGNGETVIGMRPMIDPETGASVFELSITRDDFGVNDEDGDGYLLEFSFDDLYRPVPLRVVFQVPDHLVNPGGNDQQQSSGSSSNQSTTSTTSRAAPAPAGDAGAGVPATRA